MSKRNHHRRPVEAVKRPEGAEGRRLRAAELLAQGRSQAEVAETVGVSRESVRRWQARLDQGGVAALRRRRAGGRPPKLSDAQAARSSRPCWRARRPTGSLPTCGPWNGWRR
jgi:transposase